MGSTSSVRRLLGATLVGLLVSVGDARGQVFAPVSRTLFARTWMVRSDVQIVRAQEVRRESQVLADPARRRARTVVSVTTVVYGLRPGLNLIAALPVATEWRSQVTDRGPHATRRTGLGDLVLLAQFDELYRRDWTGGTTRLAVVGGVKLPSGTAPFSTGSTDGVAGLILSRFGPRWWLSADAELRLRGTGAGIDWGSVFTFDASLAYRARRAPAQKDLFLIVEVNGESERPSRLGQERLADVGGRRLFVSPAVLFLVRPTLIVEGGVQLPLVQRLRGSQLSQTLRALVGIRFVAF